MEMSKSLSGTTEMEVDGGQVEMRKLFAKAERNADGEYNHVGELFPSK